MDNGKWKMENGKLIIAEGNGKLNTEIRRF